VTFLRGWLAGSGKLSPKHIEAQADLKRLAESQPSLAQHALILAELLPTLFEEKKPPQPWSLPSERLTAKLTSGIPLLRGENAPFETKTLRRRWQAICGILVPSIPAAERLGNSLDIIEPQELVAGLLAGRSADVASRFASLGMDTGLAATVLRWTLFPILTQIQAELAVPCSESRWPHGFCYLCGAWPIFGELRGLEQLRYLRCGLCAAAWEFPRLRCPFCGNDDHRLLGYLHREGEEGKERVATCDACRGYVKLVSALVPLAPVQLLVKEIATLTLDLVAAERGYSPP
jgi:FdhE protein